MKISIEVTAKEAADLIKELNQPHNVNVDNFVKTLTHQMEEHLTGFVSK